MKLLKEEQPHYKILNKGTGSLTDIDLLTNVININGKSIEQCMSIARKLFQEVKGNWNNLAKLDYYQLLYKGLSPKQALNLINLFEVSRRKNTTDRNKELSVSDSKTAFRLFYEISDSQTEIFEVAYLNRRNRLIKKVRLSNGSDVGTVVSVKLILKKAIELGACTIICAHNHPSGHSEPSKADKEIAVKLKNACKLVDMELLDNLIITEYKYTSFADEGLI